MRYHIESFGRRSAAKRHIAGFALLAAALVVTTFAAQSAPAQTFTSVAELREAGAPAAIFEERATADYSRLAGLLLLARLYFLEAELLIELFVGLAVDLHIRVDEVV